MNDNSENKTHEEYEAGKYLPVYVKPKRKPFRRSKSNRIFLGLCGGIAEYLNIDSAFVRIVFAISILIGGWGVIAYIVAAVMIPSETSEDLNKSSESVRTHTANTKLLLGNLLLLTGFFFTFNIYGIVNYFSFIGIPPEIFGSFTMIFAGIYIYTQRNSVSPGTGKNIHLRRSSKNRRLSGFCGGMAEYMNTDSNVVRMLWLIFTFATLGLGFVLYFFMWIILPAETVTNE